MPWRIITQRIPKAELHLYGDGPMEVDLRAQVRRLGLENHVKFPGGLPLEQVVEVVANADVGIVPKRADSFGNQAYSTKIMEFMSQGVPAVISRTEVDSYYFDDSVVRFFPSGDAAALASAVIEVLENPELRSRLIANGLEYAARNDWNSRRGDYLHLVDSLSTEPVRPELIGQPRAEQKASI